MAIAHATLASSQPGRYRCEQIVAAGENAIRLKRLGICEGREIEVLGDRDPMVIKIGAARVGLSRQLAALVTVDPVLPASALGS